MTQEQFEHYIKGGKFKAIYKPRKKDISKASKAMRGKETVAYQNMLICPIQDDQWNGQHCFNSTSIHGWFPSEDIEILEILNEVIPNVEPLPQYMYRLYYFNQQSIIANFGKQTTLISPFRAARNFNREMDDYILKLSTPQADRIEKAVWKGRFEEEIKWKTIHENVKVIDAKDVFEAPKKPEYNIEEQDSLE